jgi:Ca-activated chloride channel homolog
VIFRNPQCLLLLALLPALALAWRWRGRRVPLTALVLRLLSVALVIAALADPVRALPNLAQGQLVLLVDQSDSLGETGKAALRDQAAARARAEPNRVHVLYFGANTVSAPDASLRATNSDIAGALLAARELVGERGRIALLSDGAQTRGDALATAQALGVPIDTLAYQTATRPEIWVAGMEVPRTLREGEEYTINVVVGSSAAAEAQLAIDDGMTQLVAQQIQLSAGENNLTYQARAGQPGILRLRATLEPGANAGQGAGQDTFAQNNRGAATALVAARPRVLLIESRAGMTAPLQAALRPAGIDAETIEAQAVPARLSDLEDYEGVVLVDVPAGDLTLDQMITLREFVRSMGRGLVATGGRSSFTLGAYKGTPLEEALPVEMSPPPRPERSNVTLLLIIDHSYSMAASRGVSKFDMAKEAAILATEALREEDRVGVLAFDDKQQWTVEFETVGTGLGLGTLQDRIGAIQIGAGTDIRAALEVGLPALAAQPGGVRHAVLLTDGRSFETTRGPYRELIEQARAQNITLSSIAIGNDSDTELLQDLAQWGAGRYHFAAVPNDIPRLTLLESEIARTEPQVEGDFRADLQTPHPTLRDFAPNEIPRLEGYVATTLKPAAELVLKSPEDDPVLAVWQYGLGRAVAWTPSIDAPWAQSWPSWPEYGKFWAQIIRYTLPEPDSGPLQVRVTPRGDPSTSAGVAAVTISADALAPSGEPLDLADTEATITLPDGLARSIPLRQTAPGHYAEEVVLPADGPYAIEVRQRKDGAARTTSAGYIQRPSAEYLPAQGSAELLARISQVSGGKVLADLDDISPANVERRGEIGLWLWLLLAAAVLWPIEIAVRRLGISR